MLPEGEGRRIEKETDKNWRLRKIYDPMLREIIKDHGFDGIVYANTQEGSGDSYIVFDADRIQFALSQTFVQMEKTNEFEDQIEDAILTERERAR